VEAHAKFPDRFIAGIEIPVRDPQMCLKELNRMAGKPGMRAVHLPNSVEGRDYLFEPAYEPVLARCEELGYPLLFHPLDGEDNIYAGKERLGNPLALSANINNTLGFTFESATTAAKFIITGTLDKFPNLEIVLPHSGGCFPYIAGRVERGLVAKKFKLPRPFREYIRRFHYDTLTFYPETMRFLINLVGADRVVIGTDNYAAMDVGEPNELVERLNLSTEKTATIFSGETRRGCSVFRWLTFIAAKETQEEFRNAKSFAGHFLCARDGIQLLPGCVCSRQRAIQTGEDSAFGPNT
jgi:aminocarboxymuconate-semialdehyde decarboxylase